MNRLIIVGNGFDLAHGLKTSYADFLLWYLKKSMRNRENLESKLITIEVGSSFVYHKCIDVSDLLSKSKVNGDTVRGIGRFIDSILEEALVRNWVDIERAYYKVLLKVYEIYKAKNDDSFKLKALEQLKNFNIQLEELTEELVLYLKEQDGANSLINDEFTKILKVNTMVSRDKVWTDVEHCKILNFNYTNTVSRYVNDIGSDKVSELKIHGSLDKLSSIVFGFGDEMDENYEAIENLNENVFFKHIKSFKYFQNSTYQNLISFINSGVEFEVFVLGHSLGLSDRTMLNEIFNSEYLKRVKIFYYVSDDGKDDYTEKTFEISRHFKDNANMRVKIVSKDLSEPMPKIIN